MFRALIFLHCDGCHRMYHKLETTIYSDPRQWAEETKFLAAHAAKVGWYIPPSWENLLCTACNEEMMNVEF